MDKLEKFCMRGLVIMTIIVGLMIYDLVEKLREQTSNPIVEDVSKREPLDIQFLAIQNVMEH